MSKNHILVVDDEEDILELVRYNLEKGGFQVSCAETGTKAVQLARTELPDLILLDLMLPGLDGFEVSSRLKTDTKTKQIPIIMVTAKGSEADIVRGLEAGADDYIAKPFSPKVLVARVKAVLRRKGRDTAEARSTIRVHDVVIHPGRHEVVLNGSVVQLTFTEFRVLEFLARRPGWVFTRNQIMDAVRGEDYMVTERSVDVQIVGLRKKLGEYGSCIETVRGVGYRFKE